MSSLSRVHDTGNTPWVISIHNELLVPPKVTRQLAMIVQVAIRIDGAAERLFGFSVSIYQHVDGTAVALLPQDVKSGAVTIDDDRLAQSIRDAALATYWRVVGGGR